MNIIEARKKINDLEKRASRAAKKQSCFLCGEPQTSFCRSHLIPDFVLRNISQDGYVVFSGGVIDINAACHTDMQVVDYSKGHREAGTFQIICKACDSCVFSDYESEVAMLGEPTNRMLAEIALKNHLMVLSKRFVEVELYDILDREIISFEHKEALDEIHQQDIVDQEFQLRRCKKIIDKNLKSGYLVIFATLLDWVAPIAVHTPIAIYRDLEGSIVNDIYNISNAVKIRDSHLVVFPLKNKTAILFFYHRDDRNYIKFHRQFSKLTYQQQLEMINFLIFKYSENYMISPFVDPSILKNAALQKLSSEAGDFGELGIIDIKDIVKKHESVKPSDIPNFLLMKLLT